MNILSPEKINLDENEKLKKQEYLDDFICYLNNSIINATKSKYFYIDSNKIKTEYLKDIIKLLLDATWNVKVSLIYQFYGDKFYSIEISDQPFEEKENKGFFSFLFKKNIIIFNLNDHENENRLQNRTF